MTTKPVVEIVAKAISGAPCPSKRSMGKAVAAVVALDARGYAIVPKEPTEGMVAVGGEAIDHPSVYMGGPSLFSKRKAKRAYVAMLAAAAEDQP